MIFGSFRKELAIFETFGVRGLVNFYTIGQKITGFGIKTHLANVNILFRRHEPQISG